MKKKILFCLTILMNITMFSQINKDVALKYLAEVQDTNLMYRDAFITNADDGSWPAVGIFRIEVSLYYSYSDRYGENLKMISKDYSRAAMRYTEYFIYNQLQNLVYYVYGCESYGSMVIKYTGNAYEFIEKSEDKLLSENYFIDLERDLSPDIIRKHGNSTLSYSTFLWGTPNFQKQILIIRDKYNEINNMNNLVERKKDNIIGYYNNNALVKLVIKEEIIKEYYVDNEVLIFAFYSGANDMPAKRVYYNGWDAFWVVFGKESLKKETEEFMEISDEVRNDYRNAIESL